MPATGDRGEGYLRVALYPWPAVPPRVRTLSSTVARSNCAGLEPNCPDNATLLLDLCSARFASNCPQYRLIMNSTLFRSCLLWLMILIIPAQAVAGVVSAACGTAGSALQQSDIGNEHAGHHSMASEDGADNAGMQHIGCVLCASSCHGVSALTSANLSLVPTPLSVVGYVGEYRYFAGPTPEPLKRPPRTVLL